MDKNRFFVMIMLALSVISLGITLNSASYASAFIPGGGVP